MIEWEIETGKEIRRFGGHGGAFSIDFSPDYRYMVVGGYSRVLLWNYETGELIRRFDTGYLDVWTDVRFSADGQTFFSVTIYGPLVESQVAEWPVSKLVTWAHENRYVRDFTCSERMQYRIEPLCG